MKLSNNVSSVSYHFVFYGSLVLGLLRRQLIKPNDSLDQFEPIKPAELTKVNPVSVVGGKLGAIQHRPLPAAKINIQDEFIEEEQTDSDMDAAKPNGPKKKKKIYRCKRCNKVCNSKNALHYHYLSHTGERNHRCDECGKCFFASSALKVCQDHTEFNTLTVFKIE